MGLLLRPIGVTENDDKIASGLDAIERVPVFGKCFEEFFPAIDHHLLGLMNISLTINERVVLRHEESQPAQILIIDAVIELKCDEFGVFCVHVGSWGKSEWRELFHARLSDFEDCQLSPGRPRQFFPMSSSDPSFLARFLINF